MFIKAKVVEFIMITSLTGPFMKKRGLAWIKAHPPLFARPFAPFVRTILLASEQLKDKRKL
jgi:hypothetical protein